MDLGPTPEQLAKDRYEAPQRDQKRNQTAFRRKSLLETIRLDRTWKVLCMLVDDCHSLHEIGRTVGPYKDRAQATSWAYGVIEVGLDVLALHWGLVRRPDG